jgi:hypothetical protein
MRNGGVEFKMQTFSKGLSSTITSIRGNRSQEEHEPDELRLRPENVTRETHIYHPETPKSVRSRSQPGSDDITVRQETEWEVRYV